MDHSKMISKKDAALAFLPIREYVLKLSRDGLDDFGGSV
jgi:hypothetical protein